MEGFYVDGEEQTCCALIYLNFDKDNYIFCNIWELESDVPVFY